MSCHHLEVLCAPSRVTRFANGCLEVQLFADCRERDVFVVRTLVPPVQETPVELLLMPDAARGASAGAARALTMTLHSPQVHGYFPMPVDHRHALRGTRS